MSKLSKRVDKLESNEIIHQRKSIKEVERLNKLSFAEGWRPGIGWEGYLLHEAVEAIRRTWV